MKQLKDELMASEVVRLLQEEIKNGGDAPVFIAMGGCYSNVRIVDRYDDGDIRLSYD